MGWYWRVIIPRLCDLALDRPLVAKQRRVVLSDARGHVLEIGFGTGLNLPHYPDGVNRIAAIDPNPGMHRRAQKRVTQSGIEVQKWLVGSERLPFDDASFDCAVSTFTLCSIENVGQALGEVYRVLRPGGRFLFLEHGRSPDPRVAKWQRRLNWIEGVLADNCRLDRNVGQLVRDHPFRSVEIDEFYLADTPRTHGYIYRGAATK